MSHIPRHLDDDDAPDRVSWGAALILIAGLLGSLTVTVLLLLWLGFAVLGQVEGLK